MRPLLILTVPGLVTLLGCSSVLPPTTFGEQQSGYTYVPLDPLPVDEQLEGPCWAAQLRTSTPSDLVLQVLPDNAVRMLVEQLDTSGKVTYTSSNIGASHGSYKVTIDYINADTVNVPLWIARWVNVRGAGEIQVTPTGTPPTTWTDDKTHVTSPVGAGSDHFVVRSQQPSPFNRGVDVLYNIPVYVGLGLRVAATVEVISVASSNAWGER